MPQPNCPISKRVDATGVVGTGHDRTHSHRHSRRVANHLVNDPPCNREAGVEPSAVALLAPDGPARSSTKLAAQPDHKSNVTASLNTNHIVFWTKFSSMALKRPLFVVWRENIGDVPVQVGKPCRSPARRARAYPAPAQKRLRDKNQGAEPRGSVRGTHSRRATPLRELGVRFGGLEVRRRVRGKLGLAPATGLLVLIHARDAVPSVANTPTSLPSEFLATVQ